MKIYKLAIIGATGLVGRTALTVLEEKNLPNFEYTFFASQNSKGKKITFLGKEYNIEVLNENSFDSNFDFAIFAAGGAISKKFAPIAKEKGTIVIDNSSAYRMEKDVPLIVPEVNSEDIKKHNGIIANPNCSTIQAVIPLKILDDMYTIKRIVYSTYQAVSGAGQKGVDDLTTNINNPQKFPYPIVNNCLPHIDVFESNGYTKEEMKMINETRKILNKPNLKITATAVRVPVLNSHSESINVEFEKEVNVTDIKNAFKNADGIILADNPEENIYPLAQNASGQDKVLVGRIRKDESVESGINFWCCADNIRKGAATNAIQIMEKIISSN